MDRTTFTSDLLKQSKDNPDTVDSHKILRKIAEHLTYYKQRDLFKEPDSKAKWILGQIQLFESVRSACISQLSYILSLKSELQKKEDCISLLFYENEKLRIDNYLLKEHLIQSIDGYEMLYKMLLHEPPSELFQYKNLKSV